MFTGLCAGRTQPGRRGRRVRGRRVRGRNQRSLEESSRPPPRPQEGKSSRSLWTFGSLRGFLGELLHLRGDQEGCCDAKLDEVLEGAEGASPPPPPPNPADPMPGFVPDPPFLKSFRRWEGGAGRSGGWPGAHWRRQGVSLLPAPPPPIPTQFPGASA